MTHRGQASRPGPATAWRRAPVSLACFVLLLAACEPDEARDDSAGDTEAGEPLEVVTEEGPVRATVRLAPSAPRLGDALELTLRVDAEAGVSVEMPDFGEALGRFAIIDFRSEQQPGDDGGVASIQHYRLEAPLSGRHRIPRLRIEYVDQRSAGAPARPRELLTEELPLRIEPVLPQGAVAATLLPMREPLAERRNPALVAAAIAAALLALAAGAVWLWRHRRQQEAERLRESAYDRAIRRLTRLEVQGIPDEGAAGVWYVELSDIVRRYIEQRYTLRAPELTTEEFLREAGQSAAFSGAHRALLAEFLERCDRVKFAAYRPGTEESREALGVARRFLTETRVIRTAQESAAPETDQAAPAT